MEGDDPPVLSGIVGDWDIWSGSPLTQVRKWIPLLEFALVPLVVFQSMLGMFTVTLLLKPLVVSLHLMGGLTILSVLWWSLLRDLDLRGSVLKKFGLLNIVGWLAFSALIVQIFLGGWTSTNYAALACTDFPSCHGSLMPPLYFREAFTLWRGLGIDYEYGVLDSLLEPRFIMFIDSGPWLPWFWRLLSLFHLCFLEIVG